MIRTLRVQIDIPADNAAGLSYLGFLTERNNGRFPIHLIDVSGAVEAEPLGLDFSGLNAPEIRLQLPMLVERLSAERSMATFEDQRAKARALGEALFEDEEQEDGGGEAHAASPPPAVSKPAPTESKAPLAREALVGKTVPVTPRLKAANGAPPAGGTLCDRFLIEMRRLKSAGLPLPANSAIAEALGVGKNQIAALMSTLRMREFFDYEWRPAPIDADLTRQQRFVIKA